MAKTKIDNYRVDILQNKLQEEIDRAYEICKNKRHKLQIEEILLALSKLTIKYNEMLKKEKEKE
jgi:hypothetical protein